MYSIYVYMYICIYVYVFASAGRRALPGPRDAAAAAPLIQYATYHC